MLELAIKSSDCVNKVNLPIASLVGFFASGSPEVLISTLKKQKQLKNINK